MLAESAGRRDWVSPTKMGLLTNYLFTEEIMKSRSITVMGCALVVLGVLLSVVPASADICIKNLNHTDSMTIMGQSRPASNDTVVFWMTPTKACFTNGGASKMIFDVEKALIYSVDAEQKTYSVIPANWMQELEKQLAQDSAGDVATDVMKAAMGSMEMTVTPTAETKKIGEYDTKKFVLEMKMAMVTATTDMWITELPGVDWEMYYGLSNAMLAQVSGFDKAMVEMKKIKGIPVESFTTATMMGNTMKSSGKLLEYSTKDAPAGTFDIPEGYTEVKMPGPMGQ
jgi:hypothetical protein